MDNADMAKVYGGRANELIEDTEAQLAAIDEIAEKLALKIMNDKQCIHYAYNTDDSEGLKQVIAGFFECQSEEDAPHDWIGEALARRRECAALIGRLGDVQE